MLLAVTFALAAQQAQTSAANRVSSSVLWTLRSPDGGQLGYSLAALGDIDGDHVGDLLVGSPKPQDCFKSFLPGSVVFVSGARGRVISSIVQPDLTKIVKTQEDGFFGSDVHALGDIDGDGYGDAAFVTIDSSDWMFERGAVVSGRTRAQIGSLGGAIGGWTPRIVPLGDLDGDGRDDWLTRAIDRAKGAVIEVHSGDDDRVLFAITSDERGEHPNQNRRLLGDDLARIGDLDHDGIEDFAATGWCESAGPAWVHLFSGRDGRYLRSLRGAGGLLDDCWSVRIERFGESELLLHAQSSWRAAVASSEGEFHVLSLDGNAGRVLAISPDYAYSQAPCVWCVIDDCDGDGVHELVVRPHDYDTKQLLRVLSGRTGAVVGRLQVPSLSPTRVTYIDQGLANVGDLDGDGRAEIAVQLRAGEYQSPEDEYALCVLKIVPRSQ